MYLASPRKARIIHRRLRFGPTIAKFFALVILVILGVVALTSSTNSATKLYKKSNLIKERGKISAEVEDLKFWAERQKTLKNIDSEAIKQNMVPVDNPDYIEQSGEVAGSSAEAADASSQ